YEIEFQEGRDLEIKSNTTNNILHIENAGNVGIGASNPDEALHITRDADGGSVRLLIENKSANSAGSTDETAGVFFGFDGDNYAGGIQLNKASDYTSTSERDSYLSFYTDRNGTLGDPKMVIRSNGNIGIGTNTPSHTLDLRDQGDIGFHSTGADKDMIVFYDGGWKMHWIRAEYSGGGDDGNDLVFDTSSKSNALVIERSGDIGIGTSGPTRPLDVVGLARIRGLGAGDVKTDSSGNLLVSSDERLKNISGNFKRGLDAILGLTPINYTWNELSTLETENSYSGFSAQNVQANIPEAVGIDSRGYLTLSDRPITAALVNSVKELKAENDSL
ncbi:MAG: tail fiber domain-containing protein, partial [Flavobacteriaceae bacterium]